MFMQRRQLIDIEIQDTQNNIDLITVDKNYKIKTLKLVNFQFNGHAIEYQRFYFNGQLLQDESTLGSYGIENNSRLIFIAHTVFQQQILQEQQNQILNQQNIQIFVKTLTGKTITLDVNTNDQVKNLKYKIQQCEGIPFNQQRIILNGHNLEDELTLLQYNVMRSSTVHLLVQLRGC